LLERAHVIYTSALQSQEVTKTACALLWKCLPATANTVLRPPFLTTTRPTLIVSGEEPAPRLQRLHLSEALDDSIDAFESAPQLHCFRLDWSMKEMIVKVPWNQLREFRTGWCGVDDYLAFLRSTPNLEVLVAWLASMAPRHPILLFNYLTSIL